MAEAGLLAGLELLVRLVLVLVHVLQEVRSQGRWEWMRKIGVDHNTIVIHQRPHDGTKWALSCGQTRSFNETAFYVSAAAYSPLPSTLNLPC